MKPQRRRVVGTRDLCVALFEASSWSVSDRTEIVSHVNVQGLRWADPAAFVVNRTRDVYGRNRFWFYGALTATSPALVWLFA
jgi:hypothetical protein